MLYDLPNTLRTFMHDALFHVKDRKHVIDDTIWTEGSLWSNTEKLNMDHIRRRVSVILWT